MMGAVPTPTTRTPADAVRGLWRTLSDRDYDGIADWVTDDCLYLDVPLGPAFAARGPVDIAKRLRVGWGGLAAYENHDGLLVADGDGELAVGRHVTETPV